MARADEVREVLGISQPPPMEGPLVDTFGRAVTDLRVSVVDRCNFRCVYCMPAEGLPWLPREEVLTVAEIERLVGLFVSLGVREIKLTGGEPTVRPELPEIVRRVRALGEDLDISITTNGYLLDRLAAPLRRAGLDRVTVSCDSLLRHRFAEMTRRDALERVRTGLLAAEEAGYRPIKLNCVVIRGSNEDEVVDFARLARATGYEVRFIEYMPLDADRAWEHTKVVPSAEVYQAVDRAFPLVAAGGEAQPATLFRFADGAPGAVGFISSVTEPFCASCNRIRITADGQLRVCLFALEETDLKGPMRLGASDAELARLARQAVWAKWAGHRIEHPDFVRPSRSMSMIGG
jgi:cyclic pyranopterin phosphate synthase